MVFSESEINEKLAAFPGWSLAEDGQLHRVYIFKNFAGAMLFANAVGHLAEAADHHPDLFIHNYRYLAISVMTHSEKGVTERDFALIRQIEALPHKD